MTDNREIIFSSDAPAALGPYSQAVKVGNMVYSAGQTPIVPGTGKLVEGDISAQTHQVMSNLQAVLAAAGTSLENVVKTTIFVTNLADFATINQAYGSYFSGNPPARSTVQVAGLPMGADVEIEVVAIVA